jgi:hypothetical protein
MNSYINHKIGFTVVTFNTQLLMRIKILKTKILKLYKIKNTKFIKISKINLKFTIFMNTIRK